MSNNRQAVPAISVGKWPLPAGTYDPALDDAGIPVGASLYGLFDEAYSSLSAPESIPGLRKVSSLAELTDGCYNVYKSTSGFSYIVALTDKPLEVMAVKIINPTIEDAINEKLTGDARKNALDFAAYMSANEMIPEWNQGTWVYHYQNKPVCVVYVSGDQNMPGPWTIWHSGYNGGKYAPDEIPAGEDADTIGLTDCTVDEQLKEIAWSHINICGNCGCGRQPGRRTMVFGREFDKVCTSTLAFTNPDVKTLEHAKKLAELMKTGIASFQKAG